MPRHIGGTVIELAATLFVAYCALHVGAWLFLVLCSLIDALND